MNLANNGLSSLDKPWLVIFDIAEELSIIQSFWPRSAYGHILVTTQNSSLSMLAATAIAIEPLDPLTDDISFDNIPDYALACATANIKGTKIGVLTSLLGKLELEEAKSLNVAVSVLEMLVATVVHNVALLAEERWMATTRL